MMKQPFLATLAVYCGSMGSFDYAQQQVTSQTVVPIAMEPNGGHLMIIEDTAP